MTSCPSCGTPNTEGARFCVKCGTTLSTAPAPESWRAPSGDLNQTVTDQSGSSTGGYTPPSAGPSAYPTYTPPQNMQYQPQAPGAAQPMHPAVPAIISLFVPSLGLLMVPNKAGLGIGILIGYIIYWGIAFVLSFVLVGFCLFLVLPIINILAAIHSWDEAAKASRGQFQPILFK
jgi:hypothetical protein